MERRSPSPRKREPMPLRFGDDALLWASWLYYEEGLTQGEIADVMGASRPTVNAYLADARARGIVNITIASSQLSSVTVAKSLTEAFALKDCFIIPSEGGNRSLIDRLGAAGAQALAAIVRPGDHIAITWGRTMLALANAVPNLGLTDTTVVQATGGTTAAIPYTPEACATRLADHLNARMVPISAPAILSSPEARAMMLAEPVIAEQMAHLAKVNCIFYGVSSLRKTSTIHSSGFFDEATSQGGFYDTAAGSLAGRFIDATGQEMIGPLAERTLGIELPALKRLSNRVLVAGAQDKIGPILAALRGGYVTHLVTDADTGEGILRAAGITMERLGRRGRSDKLSAAVTPTLSQRTSVKKFLNAPKDAVNEALEGAIMAFGDYIEPINGNIRALRSKQKPVSGKVGLVIGGGAGHEPCFLGFVGPGLADATAVGNVFASPPPDRILACTKAVDNGAGVLYIYGNYTGDVMNFDMAADLAMAEGIAIRTVVTTDDIASAPTEDRFARRGTAGNIFTIKVAGAACDRLLPLSECERLAQKANDACLTIGVALEPCSLPDTRRPSFQIGPDEIEFGVGVHGEPGAMRIALQTADHIIDQVCDRIFAELPAATRKVALLVNSLGGTPQLELFILRRRIGQRFAARGLEIGTSLVGHYVTSLDMIGASVTVMALDDELTALLDAPCKGFAWQR